MLRNTYNICFEQYSNKRKKKVTQIIQYSMWKKVYPIYTLVISITPCRRRHWRRSFEIAWRRSRLEGRIQVNTIIGHMLDSSSSQSIPFILWSCGSTCRYISIEIDSLKELHPLEVEVWEFEVGYVAAIAGISPNLQVKT